MTGPRHPSAQDESHPIAAIGAVKTRVLLLLIALVVLGTVAAVIGSHFLLKDEASAETPAPQRSTAPADTPAR